MRLAATQDDIFDLSGIELGRLAQNVLNTVRRQIVWPGDIERSTKRFCQRRP
jgi:hypothetical protein